VPRTYRALLQISLHDAPNPLDPLGATDWSDTRASAFAPVEVAMTDEIVTREQSASVVTTRPLAPDSVWALFVDRWGPAKPVYWAAIDGGLEAGEAFEVVAGRDHLTIDGSFAVRNVARTATMRR